MSPTPPPHIPDWIPGVFNYCLRWCERCVFADRCREQTAVASLDIPDSRPSVAPVVMRTLPTHLEEVLILLEKACEAAGFDWQLVKCDLDAGQPRSGDLSLRELREVSASLAVQLVGWLEIYREEEPQVRSSWQEALPVLHWYGVLQSAKVARAITGLEIAFPGEPPENGPDNIRSDGNATAKVATLALVRALAALSIMLGDPKPFEEELLTFTLDLLRIQQSLRYHYPYAAGFERPGFDDPDFQEEIEAFYEGYLPIDPFRDGPWQMIGGRAPQD